MKKLALIIFSIAPAGSIATGTAWLTWSYKESSSYQTSKQAAYQLHNAARLQAKAAQFYQQRAVGILTSLEIAPKDWSHIKQALLDAPKPASLSADNFFTHLRTHLPNLAQLKNLTDSQEAAWLSLRYYLSKLPCT